MQKVIFLISDSSEVITSLISTSIHFFFFVKTSKFSSSFLFLSSLIFFSCYSVVKRNVLFLSTTGSRCNKITNDGYLKYTTAILNVLFYFSLRNIKSFFQFTTSVFLLIEKPLPMDVLPRNNAKIYLIIPQVL